MPRPEYFDEYFDGCLCDVGGCCTTAIPDSAHASSPRTVRAIVRAIAIARAVAG